MKELQLVLNRTISSSEIGPFEREGIPEIFEEYFFPILFDISAARHASKKLSPTL